MKNYLSYHHEPTVESFFSNLKYEIGYFDYSDRVKVLNALESQEKVVLNLLKRLSL